MKMKLCKNQESIVACSHKSEGCIKCVSREGRIRVNWLTGKEMLETASDSVNHAIGLTGVIIDLNNFAETSKLSESNKAALSALILRATDIASDIDKSSATLYHNIQFNHLTSPTSSELEQGCYDEESGLVEMLDEFDELTNGYNNFAERLNMIMAISSKARSSLATTLASPSCAEVILEGVFKEIENTAGKDSFNVEMSSESTTNCTFSTTVSDQMDQIMSATEKCIGIIDRSIADKNYLYGLTASRELLGAINEDSFWLMINALRGCHVTSKE